MGDTGGMTSDVADQVLADAVDEMLRHTGLCVP